MGLMNAMQSRPNLLTGMQNPRIQEAIQLMQKDPQGAHRKYKDDPEVMDFLKEFSGLMATHFDVLSKEEGSKPKTTSSPAPADNPVQIIQRDAASTKAAAAAPSTLEPLPIDDPKVAAAFSDPEVQHLIASLRAGKAMEMHELCRRNLRLFEKVKILLD